MEPQLVDSSVSLYRQIYNAMKSQIVDKKLLPGERFPSESALAEQFQVSRITVRKALADLQSDGLVIKRRGKGTYVTDVVMQDVAHVAGSFSDTCRAQGLEPETLVISSERRRAEIAEALDFGLGEGSWLISVTRLRSADGKPRLIEIDTFRESMSAILSVDLEKTPLGVAIEQISGQKLVSYVDTFGVEAAKKRDAEWLGCAIGTPLLIVDQIVLDGNGVPVYMNQQRILTSAYTYVVRH